MGLGGVLALLASARSPAVQLAIGPGRVLAARPFSIECGSRGTGLAESERSRR
jgi:hypothetical protein